MSVSRAFHPETYPNDYLASLLEELVRPHLLAIQRNVFRVYSLTLDAWVASESSIEHGYDTERLERLIDRAWDAATTAIAPWDPLFAVPAIRSIPTQAIDFLCEIGGLDPRIIHEISGVATAAAANRRGIEWRWWRKAQQRWISPGRVMRSLISESSPEVVGGCIGASLLMAMAQRWYRGAGKGLRIRTMPARLEAQHLGIINRWEGGALLLLPAVELAQDAPIDSAIRSYDDRREKAFRDELLHGALSHSAKRMWFVTRRPDTRSGPRLFLPALDFTFFPTWDIHADHSVEHWIGTLRPFDDVVASRIGINCDELLAGLCTLATLIERRTHCADIIERSGRLVLPTLQTEAAGRELASLIVRGMLRFTRDDLHRALGERFVRAMTGAPSARGLPAPILFYNLDSSTLLLDLAPWHDFREACFRVATEGSGAIGNRRGDIFEESARSRIIAALKLTAQEMPWPAGRELHLGARNFGDVDFCFLRDGVLVNLDMKGWLRSSSYHVGHHGAINKKSGEFVEYMRKVEERGAELQRQLVGSGFEIRERRDFLIVPSPIYLPPDQLLFWYIDQPRVITVQELVRTARPQPVG
jgi:hypothetical protein